MSDIKVNWFEIPVRDEDRAEKFYGLLLDRSLGVIDGPDGKIRVFMSENGAEGTLSESDRNPGQEGVMIHLHCPDIDAALTRCKLAGGSISQSKMSNRTVRSHCGGCGSRWQSRWIALWGLKRRFKRSLKEAPQAAISAGPFMNGPGRFPV